MAMVGENQVRNILVASAFPEHATISALRGGSNGDLAALDSDGTAVVNDSEIMFALKNNQGKVRLSDVLKPANITSASVTQYTAPTKKVVTVNSINVTANKIYSISLIVAGFGSLSVENEIILKGHYKSKTGDNAEDIVDGLIINLSKSIGRQQPTLGTTTTYSPQTGDDVQIKDNPWFTLAKTGTDGTAAIVITEKAWEADYYVTNKKTRLQLEWEVVCSVIDDNTVDPTVAVTTAGTLGKGTGYQVRNLEAYLLGNVQDSYRGIGYPHNFEAEYDSSLTGTYNLIELEYFDESRDDPKKSKKQLTIVIPYTNLAGNSVTNLVITEINKALNSSPLSITALAVV